MRRISLMAFLLVILLAACGAGPRGRASEWAKRFPEKIGNWEFDERLELTAENQSNYGHITLAYAGADDVIAYVTIDAFATRTASDVELDVRMRQWELQGVRFERDRFEGTPIEMATTPGGFLAFLQSDDIILTLNVIPPLPDDPLPADDINVLLETMGAIADHIN